jgi:Tfp pilus assembly protein PilO
MWKMIEPKIFKMMGVYVIIILGLIRFILYPLQDSVAKKKIIFNELYETCELKEQHFARRNLDQQKPLKSRMDKETIAPYLYEKEIPFSSIHAGILEGIIKVAEKKGLVVQNFEMLEPASGKTVSEVPVLLRMSGKPLDMLDVLKTITAKGKIIQIKSLEINNRSGEIAFSMTLVAFRMEK